MQVMAGLSCSPSRLQQHATVAFTVSHSLDLPFYMLLFPFVNVQVLVLALILTAIVVYVSKGPDPVYIPGKLLARR